MIPNYLNTAPIRAQQAAILLRLPLRRTHLAALLFSLLAVLQMHRVATAMVAAQFVTQAELQPLPAQPTSTQVEQKRIEIYHTGINSTIHVVQQTATPAAGVRILTLPAMAANIAGWADGAPLQVDRLDDPPSQSSPALRVQVNIPEGVNLFSLEYDQLDGALPYEQSWYLEHEAAWGPLTATVHLPVTASITRYEGVEYATVVAPNVLQFDVPEGVYWGLLVVYATTETPDLYDTVRTLHFLVHLPRAYADYQDALASLLENTYTLFQEYSHQDVNQLAHHAYYEYYYLPGGWYWWGEHHRTWRRFDSGRRAFGGQRALCAICKAQPRCPQLLGGADAP